MNEQREGAVENLLIRGGLLATSLTWGSLGPLLHYILCLILFSGVPIYNHYIMLHQTGDYAVLPLLCRGENNNKSEQPNGQQSTSNIPGAPDGSPLPMITLSFP